MENYNKFCKRLSLAIKQSGKSTNQIERELGYKRNVLHNYKNGTEPSARRLMELSLYFSLSPSYLLGITPNTVPNNPREFFEQLSESDKIEMMNIAQKWCYEKLSEVYDETI